MSQTLTQEQESFIADVVAEQFGKTMGFARFAHALAMICEDIAGFEAVPSIDVVLRIWAAYVWRQG
ncbi:hypothetical protein [Ralstonia mannitolilytica]|uniref:hypothetical protein n=1 Tax=Ralstonia mannitolilytica TaxID=105219 RepID=UPI0005D7EB5A|nr:hypothetical protein [Ralstonia mannitolilytica]AJW44691.1 hypothetical protein TK49_08205 [Ralstonia mannitolilytica]QIF06800.1 hypothetical protein G5A69_03160 [Ralstonia mannitolilytica]CAJ0709368.1 hypothetical protein LMG8323_00597 [Ralstonia mannitolilytica]CAJ0726690.1 hypothetical protein R76706_01095 [Ralstonia mannitolilytica]CAJ0801710.1 hypothetical protein R77555_03686 [Ralstonia mannitolilytica]